MNQHAPGCPAFRGEYGVCSCGAHKRTLRDVGEPPAETEPAGEGAAQSPQTKWERLNAEGHNALAHKYNDIAECPKCNGAKVAFFEGYAAGFTDGERGAEDGREDAWALSRASTLPAAPGEGATQSLEAICRNCGHIADIAPRYELPQGGAAQEPPPQSDGVSLIAAERHRQVTAEGWTTKHDDTHRHGELAFTAARYALHDVGTAVDPSDLAQAKIALAAAGRWDSCWWKPRDPIRNLVRAGALIAAEIDRLRRATPAPAQEREP